MKIKRFLALSSGLTAGLFLLSGRHFFNAALRPAPPDRRPLCPAPELWGAAVPLDLRIRARDAAPLFARVLPAPGSRRWAVCVHGYRKDHASMAAYARHYAERGFHVLLPDLRGHGQSGGRYIGMGWPDRLDLLDWVNWIVSRQPEAHIVLHGLSMGAAAVLMATGEPLPPQVKAAVSDCAFADVGSQFRHVAKSQYRLFFLRRPAMASLAFATRLRAGFFPGRASCLRQVSRSATPTLFIHGGGDRLIPPETMGALYRRAACPVKQALLVPGAGHAQALAAAPALYWETVERFLAPLLGAQAAGPV